MKVPKYSNLSFKHVLYNFTSPIYENKGTFKM